MSSGHDRDRVALGLTDVEEDRTMRRGGPEGAPQVLRFVIDAARHLADRHFQNVTVLDVRGLSDLTDFIVIASGTSDRQILSVASEVEDLAAAVDLARYGRESDGSSTWVVLDFVDAVIHLFEPATRAHYDLEMLWGDAATIGWERDADSE